MWPTEKAISIVSAFPSVVGAVVHIFILPFQDTLDLIEKEVPVAQHTGLFACALCAYICMCMCTCVRAWAHGRVHTSASASAVGTRVCACTYARVRIRACVHGERKSCGFQKPQVTEVVSNAWEHDADWVLADHIRPAMPNPKIKHTHQQRCQQLATTTHQPRVAPQLLLPSQSRAHSNATSPTKSPCGDSVFGRTCARGARLSSPVLS